MIHRALLLLCAAILAAQTPDHLGTIADLTGRMLKWAAVKQEIFGDAATNAMTTPQMCDSWKL